MIRTADIKDRETLEGLIKGGILKGDKIKAVVDAWDSPSPSPSPSPDSKVRYKTAAAQLDCSVGTIKVLVYAGKLIPFIRPGGQRASGVLASSIQALLASNASAKYR